MPKYLFTFEKTEAVRWLGHLDILRTFERAIRRAMLPIAFSTGFNPRERLSFASALSTGITGSAEPAILELVEPLAPDEIARRLSEALPPGIRMGTCMEIPDAGSRDVLNSFHSAEYDLVCLCPEETSICEIDAAVSALMAQSQISIVREREGRSKTVDIRPFIMDLAVDPRRTAPDRVTLHVTVSVGENGNAKPGEIVAALAESAPGFSLRRAHRVRLIQQASTE